MLFRSRPVTANQRAFRIMVRNALFKRVELAAMHRWTALDDLGHDLDWEDELDPFFEEYGEIGTGPSARGPQLFSISFASDEITARQVLEDPDGDLCWSIDAVIDVEESDAAAEVVFEDITITAG